MSTALGQTFLVTIGHFTVADSNNATNPGGCTGITLNGSQTYWANLTGGGAGTAAWTVHTGGGTSASFQAGGGVSNWLFQAYDITNGAAGAATSSAVTGEVGDSNATSGSGSNQTPPTSAGIIPCVDLGGFAGQ